MISDISKLNKNSFYEVDTKFFTCNTATKNEASFAYNWFNHLGGTVQACVNKTSYRTIMFTSETPSLSERLRVNGLRSLVGFCVAGSDRYPIPLKSDNAYWVYYI